MPVDKKSLEKRVDDGGTDEHEGAPALIAAIRTEMENMTPLELERLYGVIALMEKKKTAKKVGRIDGGR